jgi:ABC-type uncharacterized transport system substrate-binding protein
MIRRREFIGLLSAAPVWPLSSRAQQLEKTRRIGVLVGLAERDPETRARLAGFRQGLEKRGWSENRNVRIDYRFAPDSSAGQAQALAKELIALQPDVILAQATPLVAALQQETSAIPIVFAGVADPIGSGFVATLPRPGSNLTGLMMFEASVTGKWLAMLKEIAPRLERAAFVINPKTAPFYNYYLRVAESVSPSLGIKLVPSLVGTTADIKRAIESFAGVPNGGLVVPPMCQQSAIAISSSRSRPGTVCRRSIRFAYSWLLVVSCLTGWTSSTCSGKRRPTSTASCAVTNQPICRFKRRPSSKRPLTSKRRRCWA